MAKKLPAKTPITPRTPRTQRKGASSTKARQKWTESDPNMRDLLDDYDRMSRHPRDPQRIGAIVSGLLSRRGYGQLAATEELESTWNALVGAALAGQTQVGKVQRGVLLVSAGTSAVLQELTFQKARLVTELARSIPQAKIRDLRIRVAAIR